MPVFYIRFSPTHQPLDFVERPVPFEGFNTRDDSATNRKPYFAEATRVGFEPFDPATQVRTGPILQGGPKVIRYTIRLKSQAELNTERDAGIEAQITPALLALAKHAGLSRVQFKTLIEAEL